MRAENADMENLSQLSKDFLFTKMPLKKARLVEDSMSYYDLILKDNFSDEEKTTSNNL